MRDEGPNGIFVSLFVAFLLKTFLLIEMRRMVFVLLGFCGRRKIAGSLEHGTGSREPGCVSLRQRRQTVRRQTSDDDLVLRHMVLYPLARKDRDFRIEDRGGGSAAL